MESLIDSGQRPIGKRSRPIATFGELIELHLQDMADIGKAPGRSKVEQLARLKRELGSVHVGALDRMKLIQFGRNRAARGVSPGTLSGDMGAIKLIMSHAAAVQGMRVAVNQVDMARVALKRMGLVGKGVERNRRPTEEELAKIITYLEARPTMKIGYMAPALSFGNWEAALCIELKIFTHGQSVGSVDRPQISVKESCCPPGGMTH